MIGLILTLVVLGVLLYLIKAYVPMDPAIFTLLTVVVIVCIVLWLAGMFVVVDIPVPRVHLR